ncbi:thermonuclease family protein [Paenibacillus cisolokensis]|jgi:Micrococcal nuclease (thermonuclease) homologs|uniref:TNase-like domain-containing protein n=1 Tax=Paenibacillus cisolokensis TaxID=1658519 RepID=A0ABQ4N4L3_9BACL|nr:MULTISPECIES: thermonuclease family protein [Paenibacillus]ALS27450.1 SNase-like protein [Paenibacillus sp. 32O-W]GIQ63110.1 hypothetical protein PACILC2_16780 [Paenibacillus cisolokensis]
MKKWRNVLVLAVLSILSILALGGCGVSDSASSDEFVKEVYRAYPELKGSAYETGTVKRVVDGDTFVLRSDDRVRMIGIDTPESTGGKVERYGKEAAAKSRSMLEGKKVYLFRDAGNTDRYGRLLRYVFVEGDAAMVNERLVAEGYAHMMTVPPNVMLADRFKEAERSARNGNRGLWGSGTAEPDASVSGTCENPRIKGNINSRGDKIYHMPDGRHYEQTKAEMMFCTEEEAVAAGFRKAKN